MFSRSDSPRWYRRRWRASSPQHKPPSYHLWNSLGEHAASITFDSAVIERRWLPIDRGKCALAGRARVPGSSGQPRASALEARRAHAARFADALPRSYIDLSQVETCGTARIGEVCTIRGTVHEIKLKKPRYNLKLVEIALVDSTGILMVTCFRQPWLMDR